jgi:hypothetical protein
MSPRIWISMWRGRSMYFGLAACTLERLGELRFRAHHAHALAAATGRRLDEQRIADVLGVGRELALVVAVIAGHRRNPGGLGDHLRLLLRTELANDARRRTDERQPAIDHGLGKSRALAEESVARMNGIRARDPRGIEDVRDHEVRVARGRRADPHGFIREPHERRIGVCVGVHRDRRDAHRATRSHHPQRDLAAVCYDQLVHAATLSRGRPAIRRRSTTCTGSCSNRCHPHR